MISSLIFLQMFAFWGAASASTTATAAAVYHINPVNPLPSARIIDGGFAPVGRYPYAVSIQGQGRQHVCGGSLIAQNLILSAAHCSVTFGEVHIKRYNMSDSSPSEQERYAILDEFIHPQYNYIDYPYDYMIIRFNGTSSISPIKLNRVPAIPTDNATLTVVGWGRNDTDGDYMPSEVLKEAEVFSVSQSSCNTYWQSYGYAITNDMMCATRKTGINCRGDSGSPLLWKKDASDGDVQVGLVSWASADCDLAMAPSVYSRISDQIDWIDYIRCLYSSEAPNDVNCSNVNFTVSEQQSADAEVPGPGQVRVSIVLTFDVNYYETGFVLEDDQGNEIYRVNPFASGRDADSLETTVLLDVESSYDIILLDSADDGFCCLNGTGSYEVYFTDSHHVLVSGFGEFEKFKRETFSTSVGSFYPEVTAGEIRIVIRIETTTSPTMLAWLLSRVDVVDQPIAASVEAGTYVGDRTVEEDILVAVKGALYSFSLTDPDHQHRFVISVGGTVDLKASVAASGVGKIRFLPRVLKKLLHDLADTL